jgi:lipopolysaccharide biosynthesis protein
MSRKLELVQKLREKAIKFRAFFEEMKQNREEIADSIQRVSYSFVVSYRGSELNPMKCRSAVVDRYLHRLLNFTFR